MINEVIKKLIEVMLEKFPKEVVLEAVDTALDYVENKVEASPNKIDDMLVLPVIKKVIREPFGIEDNDTPKE